MTDQTLFEQSKENGMSAERQITSVVESQGGPPAPISEAGAIIQMIERVAMNPAADLDKLKQLLDMRERVEDRQAERFYDEAMNACQEDMRPIAADANNPQTKSKYASYGALDKVLRPVYTKHGFSLSFDTAENPLPEHVRVVCKVAHRSGHRERPHLDMPSDGKGAKGGDVMTKTHAIGAAVTYGRRYLLGMIFNIAVGEDDDGNSNGGREFGAVARRAVETINGHKTPAEHLAWRDNHAEGVEKLVEPWEWKEIIALWNRRAKALKEAAAKPASDFPGDR